jgi:multiple sugar transport system ATP-binding protein
MTARSLPDADAPANGAPDEAPARGGASLAIRGLSRHYGNVRAVDDLNLEIPGGTFLTLLGPSGCGKSTTLSILAGLEKPDSGRVVLADEDITDVAPNERGMAMVFQSYALYPHMTVAENIGFGLKLKRRPKAEIAQRVEHVAGMLDLTHLLARRPSQLSGGQQQRVGLGRALVKQPRVFLLDEPFSNLDAALRARMRTEIKHLHLRLGTTTVFVTHDQEEAMSLSDLIAVMKDGKVVQFGTQEDIYLRPATLYVATFVGRPRMSLLSGLLVRERGLARFRGPGIEVPLTAGQGSAAADAGEPRAVVLGVRAEDVRVHPEPEAARPAAPEAASGVVRMLEPMGSDTFVELGIGEATLVARVSPELPLSIGARVGVELATDRVHLFDAGTEERI